MSWSARPCQIMIFPPSVAKADRSGLSVAMTLENSLTDCANSLSNCATVSVCQFQDGFRWSQVPSQATATGNGLPLVTPLAVVVAARPDRLAPRSSPNQSFFPCAVSGPCQIFVITAASCRVMTPHGVTDRTSLYGLKWPVAGLVMTPLVLQACTAAAPKPMGQAGVVVSVLAASAGSGVRLPCL